MSLKNIKIGDHLESISLFLDIDEFMKDKENSIYVANNNKLSWIKEEKSTYIDNMDSLFRKKLKIPDNYPLYVNVFYPPESHKDKPVEIKNTHLNISHRILISTIPESPCLTVKNKKETIRFKNNEAYIFPFPISKMINLEFDNKRTLIIPAKKGFRQLKMTKKIEKRYIIQFDYLIKTEVEDALKELKEVNGEISQND